MTSPIRQNLFERECDMPLLEARHLALLLLGLDASQPANALPEEHQENYRILHDAISRTIKATGMVSAPANKRMPMKCSRWPGGLLMTNSRRQKLRPGA